MDHVLLCILLNDLNAVCGGKTDMGEYSPLPSAPPPPFAVINMGKRKILNEAKHIIMISD